jgi:two-component system response regulator TrcR
MRILYVEDQRETARALQMLLAREGYEVEVAHSAAEATTRYTQQVFDAVILDLQLPDGHGGNLLRKLRRMSDCKAIALTGDAMPHQVDEGMHDDHFDAYLTKPVSIEQVVGTLRQLVSA